MTRSEKIQKLDRAIRAYRGAIRGKHEDGRTLWPVLPKRAERVRVVSWLDKLGVDREEMVLIDGFASADELHQWLKTIQ